MARLAFLKVPREIIFGTGCAEKVGDQAGQLHARRALLISDQGLHDAGVVDQIRSALTASGLSVELFLGVEREPSLGSVDPCAELARRAEVDLIVAVGGGSVLDTAKAVAMLATNPGTLADYLGIGKVNHPALASIHLPTTAGTGAEVTPNALFYVPERRTKEAVVSPHIVPTIAMIDPALTCSVPPAVTAATGVDALCHAVESYTGLNATPLTEPFAKEAISRIAQALRRAVINGMDLAAREDMALGSLYAAISMANSGTNGVHALAYPLQGQHRIAHGVANSLLLPYVLEFNLLGNLEKFAHVAALMGQPTGQLSLRDAAAQSARACRQLSEDVGIPKRMCDVGIAAEHVPAMVEGALAVQRLLRNNPRPMTAADVQRIYENAL